MDINRAVLGLSALAHDGRLAIFRLLVRAGPDGMAAGSIARKLDTAHNTMSAQLLVLSNAGLVQARREGRSVIYTANYERVSELLQFLTKDCCGGRPEVCAPLAAVVNSCCPPRKRLA
jgi:DNA-binding transcriptional ArsR family regulator